VAAVTRRRRVIRRSVAFRPAGRQNAVDTHNWRNDMFRKPLLPLLCAAVLTGLGSCRQTANPPATKPAATKPAATQVAAPATKPVATQAAAPATTQAGPDKEGWISLFDGKTLKGWKVPVFGGDGKVYVKDGAIHMEIGDMCTGVTYVEGDPNAPIRKLPRENYEIELEATRLEGNDFFCGLTFPVGKDHISLICDGWAGYVTGLSCLDGYDASENETTQEFDFKDKRWYQIAVSVTKTHITCWVDNKQIIRVAREGKKIGIRSEVDLSVPLGLATYQTHGAARNLRLRTLSDAEARDP